MYKLRHRTGVGWSQTESKDEVGKVAWAMWDMCIRELERLEIVICNAFPQVATQITADHLSKYNFGFFLRSRRNNRIRHFTSSE